MGGYCGYCSGIDEDKNLKESEKKMGTMGNSEMFEALEIGGVGCRELAEQYGTPLYVYDEGKIRSQARSAAENFISERFDTEVVYASKAFSCGALFKTLSEEGIGFDVVSGGELYGAKRIGADMKKVYFHGNNKSDEEIQLALDSEIGYFVIDNVMECERIIKIAAAKEVEVKALLRINPGISAHTHEYIMTSKPDSKFGIYIENKANIAKVIEMLAGNKYVELAGFHSHIGSQIVDVTSFEKAIDTMVAFLAEVKKEYVEYDMQNLELSIGGGFGIKYIEEDNPMPLGEMCAKLVEYTERSLDKYNVSISKLITEPGRAMVGEAGYTLYTIGDMKESGGKNYIFVDGGMSDNIRPALYNAEYRAVLAEKCNHPIAETYCVAGKNCESGDVLIESIELPRVDTGDLLAVFSTGAYGYSMASNYNRLGKPAVVFAEDGVSRLVLRRETFEDQYRLEV